MVDKLAALWPEVTLLLAVLIIMLMGTSKDRDVRRATTWVAAVALFFAMVFATGAPAVDSLLPGLAAFARPLICAVGLLMIVALGSVDRLYETQIDQGRKFDPLDTTQGEFLCFALLSLTGLMLCTIATDLIWLFLAVELTSLPTYVMVAISRPGKKAQEAAIKYFFLGALSASVFLFGFALLYGGTGSLHLNDIHAAVIAQADQGGINHLVLIGMALSIVGISFKIAAVPMHAYVADVYEGAATPVTAFLAFVPKAAGFFVLMLLLTVLANVDASGHLWPPAVRVLLWVMAALTMTVGNALAICQTKIKRTLAYSSVAHSGYMLVGLLAYTGDAASPTSNGFAAVVFYLLAYGITNLGAFLVLTVFQRRGEDLETFEDIKGLHDRHPQGAVILALCALSLMGLPPLVGFFAKLFLFTSAIGAGEYILVIIAGLNSAAAAWYYLGIAAYPWVKSPGYEAAQVERSPGLSRAATAAISAIATIVLVFWASTLLTRTHHATQPGASHDAHNTPAHASK